MWGHEEWAIVSTIDAKDQNNEADVRGDAIDMSKFSELLAIANQGDVDSTLAFKLMESDASGGTYTDITGKAITTTSAHASSNDGKSYVISLKAEEMTPSKRYVKPSITVGNDTANPTCVIVLGRAVYRPATDHDLSDVAQVIA
jgi:hypothetical protein